MNLIDTFKYGLVGRNIFSDRSKAIVISYKILSNFKPACIKEALLKSESIPEINIPRIAALLLIWQEKDFKSIFMNEIRNPEQMFIYYSLFKDLNILPSKKQRKLISDWLFINLSEDFAIQYKTELKKIMENFKVKRHCSYRVIITSEYILHDIDYLPKHKIMAKLKNNFIRGKCKPFHINLIDKYRIGIGDVRKFMYELTDKQKEEVVLKALKYTPSGHFTYLNEIFVGKIPGIVINECQKKLKSGSYYESLALKELIPIDYPFVAMERLSKLKVFIDASYSMQSHINDIESFMSYLQNTIKYDEIYTITNKIVKVDKMPTDLLLSEVGNNCSDISQYIEDGDTILFITDGNIDMNELLKAIRSKSVNMKMVIWFINKTIEYPSKFKNIYYFYGKAKDLYKTITEFIK